MSSESSVPNPYESDIDFENFLCLLREELLRFAAPRWGENRAQDFVQDALLSALTSRHQIRDLRAWLFSVLRRVASKQIQYEHRYLEVPMPTSSVQPIVEEAIGLLGLPRLLLEFHLEGLSIETLSLMHCKSAEAISKELQRLRRTVRNQDVSLQWSEVWCPTCGDNRLSMFSGDQVGLFCDRCSPSGLFLAEGRVASRFSGSMPEIIDSFNKYHWECQLRFRMDKEFSCIECGWAHRISSLSELIHCPKCSISACHASRELALADPRIQRFWKRNQRIYEITEKSGAVIGFRSRVNDEVCLL